MGVIPRDARKTAPQLRQEQALVAVSVAARGETGSEVAISWFELTTMRLREVADLSKYLEKSALKSLKDDAPALAAAQLADQIFTPLAVQLFYEDRWSQKLGRRCSDH